MLEKELDAKVTMEKGRGGIFDVYKEDALVFSKHKEHRFPDPEEILDALEK